MHQRRSAYFPALVCRDPGSAALRGRTPVPRARGTAVRRVVLCLKCRLVDERGSHEVPLPTWPLLTQVCFVHRVSSPMMFRMTEHGLADRDVLGRVVRPRAQAVTEACLRYSVTAQTI